MAWYGRPATSKSVGDDICTPCAGRQSSGRWIELFPAPLMMAETRNCMPDPDVYTRFRIVVSFGRIVFSPSELPSSAAQHAGQLVTPPMCDAKNVREQLSFWQ